MATTKFDDLTNEQKNQLLMYTNGLSGNGERSFFSSRIKEQIVQDLLNSKYESYIGRKYSQERLSTMLQTPYTTSNMQQLRQMSLWLYLVSSHYRRLINYYATLPTFNYYVTGDQVQTKSLVGAKAKKYKQCYIDTVNDFERYTLKQTAPEAMAFALLLGAYCGIVFEDDRTFFVKQLPINYVRIYSIIDGCFRFAVDLDYFNGKEYLLEAYGEDVKKAYYLYKGDREKGTQGDRTLRWYEPEKQICVKTDSDPTIILPFFLGSFKEILDMDDYMALAKAKAETDNYKALVMKQETDDDGIPKLDFDIAMKYYNQAASNIPSGVGLILTPFAMDSFSFDNSNVQDADAVNDARNNLWASTGTSPLIFGSTKATSAAALILSTKPDEKISFQLMYQVERNFNLLQKLKGRSYTFKMKFLNQSIYDKANVQDSYSKSAMYGVSGAKTLYAASLDLSPADVINLSYIEDEVLKMTEEIFNKPTQTSNTSSWYRYRRTSNTLGVDGADGVSSVGGRPTNESKNIISTESGEASQASDQNESAKLL